MTLESAINYFNEKDYKNCLKGFKDFNKCYNKYKMNKGGKSYGTRNKYKS